MEGYWSQFRDTTTEDTLWMMSAEIFNTVQNTLDNIQQIKRNSRCHLLFRSGDDESIVVNSSIDITNDT